MDKPEGEKPKSEHFKGIDYGYGTGRTSGFLAGKFAGASQTITQILTFVDDPELRAKIIGTMPKVKGWPETLAVWTDEDH